jgi:hypothetical protein
MTSPPAAVDLTLRDPSVSNSLATITGSEPEPAAPTLQDEAATNASSSSDSLHTTGLSVSMAVPLNSF